MTNIFVPGTSYKLYHISIKTRTCRFYRIYRIALGDTPHPNRVFSLQ